MNCINHTATIIAQCTPQGSGALALLRLSGNYALTIGDKISLLTNGKSLSTVPSHTIHYGWVIDNNKNKIDQVLFLIMHGPNSFTGDDTIEITCHNNPFIINAIINVAINNGARMAQQGEFSRRAVENNKIDIIQAEAINELIHANTQQALKQSLSQLSGSFSHWINGIEQDLIKALALSQASFEFIDEEDMEFAVDIKNIIVTTVTTINKLKKIFNQQQQIRQGIRIAIIGSVNAGKSSFFNTIVQQNRAIVSPLPGTTRDVIESGLYKNNSYWTLIDTAGLRTTNDTIEQLGITRSYEQAQKADIILLLFDGSIPFTLIEEKIYQELTTKYTNKVIVIRNKSDLVQQNLFQPIESPLFSFSTLQNSSVSEIENAIQHKINLLFNAAQSPFLLNQRHFNALLSLENTLEIIIPMLTGTVSYELLSYHLQDAIVTLSELTGKTVSESSMDAIFREFCIGK